MKKALVITFLQVILFSTNAQIVDQYFHSNALNKSIGVDVFLPPGYYSDSTLYYPVVYFLHGWGGSQNSAIAVMLEAESLITEGSIDPVIIVCANNSPAPFNGSLYSNSITSGNYEDFNINDLITWIETTYRAKPQKEYRSLMGQSMGGKGSFRYGILHKTMFRAIAAHGASINLNLSIDRLLSLVLKEHPKGAPYFFDFETGGILTKILFANSGAYSPNVNSPQTHINPPIVEFPINENGLLIDSIYQKWKPFDPVYFVKTLSPSDSVAILFGAGKNDALELYLPNVAFKDTLDYYGLEYEFFEHSGKHAMPSAFKRRALIFLDSVMPAPSINETYLIPIE